MSHRALRLPAIVLTLATVAFGSWPSVVLAISSRTLVVPIGAAAADNFGFSVESAGDVNGDGYADFIVGAWGNDAGGSGAGRAYVYYAGPLADAIADLIFTGAAVGDNFGNAVASAGDLNGDGFADLLVGAPFNDAGGSNAGRAYVYFGGPSADATADLTLTGATAGDLFGWGAASAGDVNGDGYADVIVGAYLNSAGGTNAGRAYVYFGGPSADAIADLTFTGAAANDGFGNQVASAGDVNGDGYADLIVGASGNDAGGTDAGRAYVYFGGPSADAIADLTFTGAAAGDGFGGSVASAGDVNGDGYDDLIVGARLNDAGGVDAGRTYVYFGGPLADAVADLTFTGAATNDRFGSVASAGDVNGDGYADVIVGAYLNDVGGADAGRAYVYFGGPSADATADLTFTGAAADDRFGFSVASAGDVDGDGYDDLIVGAYQNDAGGTDAGRAYVYVAYSYQVLSPNGGETWVAGTDVTVSWRGHDVADLSYSTDGGASWSVLASSIGGSDDNSFSLTAPGGVTALAKVRLSYTGQPVTHATSDQSDAVFRIVEASSPPRAASRLQLTLTGAAGSDQFGVSLASAGDMNGDGYADLIVGAGLNAAGGVGAGRAYVYFGGPSADATADLTLTGAAAGDVFGISVASAGDVNGDGYADVIVGAWGNDAGGVDVGRAYVYFGGPSADAVADLTFTGAAAGDFFGGSVASAGDVNGDGYADLIVGAYANDAGGADAGRAYVYFGGPSADAVVDLTLTGAAANDNFGNTVASAGDVNGDGYADLIVGAYANDAGGAEAGRAYLYYGGRSPDIIVDLTLTGAAAGDGFGISVASAGDVNGDGYADVIVGADGNDAGGADAGRAYVFFGGPSADVMADLALTGAMALDFLGHTVASAGDVNRDGYADVIVGAIGNDAGGSSAGRAYVYFGGPSPDVTADLTFTGAAAGDEFGVSVASAGDVSGDGFDDLFVGANLNDAGGANAGRAYLYDLNRYQIVFPNGGETWTVGAMKTISWLGAEPADVWWSMDGGATYEILESGAGGAETNSISLRVPPLPTRFARVRVTPSDVTLGGSDQSDAVFHIVDGPPSAAASRLQLTPTGAAAGDVLGTAVASAGDVNGDGYADVIVGAPFNATGGANAGRAYVYFGGPSADAIADLTFTGAAAFDNLGYSVASAGDVNGDSYADLIVGAYLNDAGGSDAGRAYVYYGGPSADAIADLTFTGAAANDNFGLQVASAGDMNGDGYADLIVGANLNDAGGTDAGRAYVYFGGPTADATADLTLTGAAANDNFGISVASAGNVNGDGYADIIVGAWRAASAGRAYVYFGGPSIDTVADLVFTGAAASDFFGISVASAGDVNADGYADVVVGASTNDAGGVDAGRAYVYFGGPSADATADVVFTGAGASDFFGSSVASAGDVNADGYGDLIVGASNNDAAGVNAGRAYVYFGGPADAAADLILNAAAAGDRFGASVATAGDVNGDGFADLIVGAYNNDAGGTNAGRAYVYDFKRYQVLLPNGGETWNVGAVKTITWLGSEPADVWLSVDGGRGYDLLQSDAGGTATNSLALRVPHSPTKFARIKLTPTDANLIGVDHSDSTFTIQSSVSLLSFEASRGAEGTKLSWASDPTVGPEGILGYRLYRMAPGDESLGGPGDAVRIGGDLIVETQYTDATGVPGAIYQLIAVNGLAEELELGRVTAGEAIRGMKIWPSPVSIGGAQGRGASGDLVRIAFAAPGGASGAGLGDLDVTVFDVSGRRVVTISRGPVAVSSGGIISLAWDGRDAAGSAVAPGAYVLRAIAPSQRLSLERKIIVVR